MTSVPSAPNGQTGRAVAGIGDEDVRGMNGVEMEYMERAQEQGGYVEITDQQGNSYAVTLEDLAAIGVDITKEIVISEEQMNILFPADSPEESMSAGPMKSEEFDDTAGNDPITISILHDGGVKLVTAGGHESYFSHSQLAEINMDSQNLSDDDIKRIVQLAAAATGEVLYEDVEKPEKRRKLDSGVVAGMEERRERDVQRMQQPMLQRNYQSIHVPSHGAASTSAGHVPRPSNNVSTTRNNNGRKLPVNNGLIGESVKIQNAKGKIVPAIVRYSRPGNGAHSAGYKVQTEDGKFEWVHPDRIIDRAPARMADRDYDHKGYTSEPPASLITATTSASSGGLPMLQRRVFASSSGGLESQRGMLPMIRHLPVPSDHQHPPNFCCPVCDRRVYQKEPAYIVIRLPACDSCTREKILIVDDSTKESGEKSGGPCSSNRPQMRSIATDTVDLPTKHQEENATMEIPSTTSPEEETVTSEDTEGIETSAEEEAGSTEENTHEELLSLVVQPQEVPLS